MHWMIRKKKKRVRHLQWHPTDWAKAQRAFRTFVTLLFEGLNCLGLKNIHYFRFWNSKLHNYFFFVGTQSYITSFFFVGVAVVRKLDGSDNRRPTAFLNFAYVASSFFLSVFLSSYLVLDVAFADVENSEIYELRTTFSFLIPSLS